MDKSSVEILHDGIVCDKLGLYNMTIDLALLPSSIKNNVLELLFNNSRIINLTELGRCNKLKLLSFDNTGIEDLSIIKNLKLNILKIRNTDIKDISPISSISTLEILDISGTKVSSIDTIIGMKINVLNITNTPAAKLPLPSGINVEKIIK